MPALALEKCNSQGSAFNQTEKLFSERVVWTLKLNATYLKICLPLITHQKWKNSSER